MANNMSSVQRAPSATYGSLSNPPPVSPRRDTRALALRRYHSSNPENFDHSKSMSFQPYESEYDKLNSKLRKSLAMRQQQTKDRVPEKYSGQNIYGRPRAQTHMPPTLNSMSRKGHANGSEDIYLSANDIATAPTTSNQHARLNRTPSPIPPSNGSNFMPEPAGASQSQVHYVAKPALRTDFQLETAIYGVAQGKGKNLVMLLKELQKSTNELYETILSTNHDSPEVAELRMHLRIGDKAPTSEILRHIHQALQPPETPLEKQREYTELYLVDFMDCNDKIALRDKILNLFATPGPPSVAYQKVNAKLDGLINLFAETVIKMRIVQNETVVSPFHVQHILQGHESEQLVRVLHANELWIRWGTESSLPPLQHIYMLKQPPTYEMRKAIVLSHISERKDILKMLFTEKTRIESLIPPIYSKLGDDNKWQVAEYDHETKKFESRDCMLPAWIEDCGKLLAHLKSGNRTTFKRGDHIYALYSIYIIVIKDITLTDGFPKESKMPCTHQIYIGSSSTGVLYRFLNVANNHCEGMKNVLEKTPMMESFRCFQECELVEACLILSWIRRQPRAVFVINSFQGGDMTNLSLDKKKPFYEKMTTLHQHYMNSKKLGPLHDMRYGMNCTGDAT